MHSVGSKSVEAVQAPSGLVGFLSSWKRSLILSLLLIVSTLAIYSRVDGFPFVNYDDTLYVTQNSKVQAGLTSDTLKWAFTTYHVGTWHPLTWMSHALDCQLFDLDPAGPHDVNLLLHVLNVLLVFWVLQRATGFTGRSFMVAALFALHPVNVESVVWIAERKNTLSLLFFLLALGAYGWYVRKPRAGRYAVVAILFAAGLMAKPQVITFPFVLLLWDYWPLRRMSFAGDARGESGSAWRKFFSLLWEKVPLFALALASAVLTMQAQRADGNKMSYALWFRLEYALVSYVQYISKALWPTRLSPFYPHPDAIAGWQVGLSAIFLAGVTWLVIAARRRRPYLLVGWFFFLGTLVPMLGLEGVGYQGKQGIADRYAYLPFLGLFIMICWGVAELAEQKRLPAGALRAVSAAVLLALGVAAYRQVSYWRDNVVLWSHALQVTQGNWLAENNLGTALLHEGRTEEGISHFYRAATIFPTDPVSNLNVGIDEQRRGNYSQAIQHYQVAVGASKDPELRAAAYDYMAACYRKLGDFEHARQSEEAAGALRR